MKTERLLNSQRFWVERLNYKTSKGAELERDVVRHPGSVAIVPILEDGQICLIRNHRITVNRKLIEIPAGTLEPPEPPLECAYRELTEETGYRAGQMKFVQSFFPAPGILDEEMHLFVATDLEAGAPAREVGEEIENFVVPLEDALQLIATGQICDAKTILGILLFRDSDALKIEG